MKKVLILTACLLAVAACSKPAGKQSDLVLRLSPVITKATATSFENGDAIGLTVSRTSGVYASNKKMVFNGLEFSSDLLWYEEGSDPATLAAYYPYSDAVPTSFTVATDQSNGLSSSDFIAAVKTDVLPTANAVTMPFKHQLTRLVISLTNNAGYTIESVTLKGAKAKAAIGQDFAATVDENSEAVDIVAYKADETTFMAIVPPQTVALTAVVTAAGAQVSQRLAEATLAPGKNYTINAIVNQKDLTVVLAGEIEDWTNGGTLQPDNNPVPVQFEEFLEDGYFTYDNVRYNIVKMDDNKYWMAQNLAYLPEGATPATDLSAVTAGVFAPLQINAAGDAAEFTTSPAVVASNGYLYQIEFALGLSVGALTSASEAESYEGAQGICPPGWHIPTIGDITGLVGKAVSPIETNTEAPYYNGANGSISLLNADGFNLQAYGGVNIVDNTRTAGLFMGKTTGYDHLTSSMMLGSTYAGVVYNTSGDETSGVKNLQFWGLMPMTNKATEAEYTCNGTKVSYRIGGPLRCVRD